MADLPTAPEYRNGLPVLTPEEFRTNYNTDQGINGIGSMTTFDFQGYVRTKDGVHFKDVLATNGLLKTETCKGIHVGTDGIVDYSAMTENRQMKGPQDVGEYDMYILVPGEIQRQTGCVCECDSCRRLDDFNGTKEELEKIYSGEGYIVIRMMLDPKEDPHARDKAAIIHDLIVHHIRAGKPLYEIESLQREWEGRLMGISENDLHREMRTRHLLA
ncbi:MAG: Uncharacterized protein Greene041619_22 [Candidatus Peregrinibacteria bacterium Greene0416_19]|nr:MAG: Uncharacterized protein Greene041619_22 [Candidatus Peregrinibacteria bacterium Greene0416_19]